MNGKSIKRNPTKIGVTTTQKETNRKKQTLDRPELRADNPLGKKQKGNRRRHCLGKFNQSTGRYSTQFVENI